MGLFKRFRQKQKQKNIDEVLERITGDYLSLEEQADEKKVQNYVLEHCHQMIDIAKELEGQKAEYRVLTAYLQDVELIENLPDESAIVLKETANNILKLRKSKEEYKNMTKKITDSQYAQMEREEETMTTAIHTLQENEKYQALVKRDMNYLEGEKVEWLHYRQEVAREQRLLRRMSYVLFGILLMFFSILLVLQVGFEVDVTYLLLILGGSFAVGSFAIYMRMLNNQKELKQAEVNINHAIALQNKTKLKYVHSTNAVDYACQRFHVHNSYELTYLWEQYMEAKRERERYERNSDDLEYFQSKLMRILQTYHLYDAKVWVNQLEALVDRRELVEVKHDLIEQRQRLRETMEYNMDMVQDQKEEIQELMKDIGRSLPEVNEIIASVNRLCGMED